MKAYVVKRTETTGKTYLEASAYLENAWDKGEVLIELQRVGIDLMGDNTVELRVGLDGRVYVVRQLVELVPQK